MQLQQLFLTTLIVTIGAALAAPDQTAACNSELGKCKEYCKVGGKDEDTCNSICTADNGICLCSTKCDAVDASCIEKCYRAVENYCENNMPVCVGFCSSAEKKEADVCKKECEMSKNICSCQRACGDEACRRACAPPPPAAP